MNRALMIQIVIVAAGTLAGAFALTQARNTRIGRDLFGRG